MNFGLQDITELMRGRSSRAGRRTFAELIANTAKVLVPGFGKADKKLLGGLSFNADVGVDEVAPGVYASSPGFVGLKGQPLRQCGAQGVVDPAKTLGGDATGNDVFDRGVDGPQNLDLQATASFPRSTFSPLQAPVYVGEAVPPL